MSISNLPNFELNDDDNEKKKSDMSSLFDGIPGLEGIKDLLDKIEQNGGSSIHITNFGNKSDIDDIMNRIFGNNSNIDDEDDEEDIIDFDNLDNGIASIYENFIKYVPEDETQPIDLDKIENDIRNSGYTTYDELANVDISNYNDAEKEFFQYLIDVDENKLIKNHPKNNSSRLLDDAFDLFDKISPLLSNSGINGAEDIIKAMNTLKDSAQEKINQNNSDNMLSNTAHHGIDFSKLQTIIEDAGLPDLTIDAIKDAANLIHEARMLNDEEDVTTEELTHLVKACIREKKDKQHKLLSILCERFSRQEFIKEFNLPEELFESYCDQSNMNLLDNFTIIPESIRERFASLTIATQFIDEYDNRYAVVSLIPDVNSDVLPKTLYIYKDNDEFKYYSDDGDEVQTFEEGGSYRRLLEYYCGLSDDKTAYKANVIDNFNEYESFTNGEEMFVPSRRIYNPLSLIGKLEIVPKYEASYEKYIYIGDVTVADTEDAKDFIYDYNLRPVDGKLKFYIHSKDFKISSANICKAKDYYLKIIDFDSDIIKNHVEVQINEENGFIYIDLNNN